MRLRSELLGNLALLLALGALFYTGLPYIRALAAAQNDEPVRLTEIEGLLVDSLVVNEGTMAGSVKLKGQPRVLYLFSTTCKYCESQHSHIAALLESLGPGSSVTASGEASVITADYWLKVKSSLDPPLSISSQSLQGLQASNIPRLYFIRADGIIHRALVGTVLGWTPERFRSEFEAIK